MPSIYEEMKAKFAKKSVVFEFKPGIYVYGKVLEVYEQDPYILIIQDRNGAEVEVDYRSKDVILT